MHFVILMDLFFFFKQKTAYEMRISDWSSDVCSSDLNQHAALWDTLGAWAERARDVDGWHRQVIAAGVTGPEAALPYQRGIMAHIEATTAGARHLAGAAEPPAAEWLAMLVPAMRYGQPGPIYLYDSTRERSTTEELRGGEECVHPVKT